MKKFEIRNKHNKVIANVFYFLDYINQEYKKKGDFIDFLIKDIRKIKEIDYAGFKDKKELKKHLGQSVFGREKFSGIPGTNFSEQEIRKIVEDTLKKCHKILKSSSSYLFIFPNFNKFKKERMNGVGGFCSWKNTILIDMSYVKGWQDALKRALAHEFHHSVIAKFKNPHKWTLLEALVYEGMADNFSKSITGFTNTWAKALSKKECVNLFPKIKKFLPVNKEKVYQRIFFGDEKKGHTLWAGYSIGYQLVKSYRKNYPDLNWNEFLEVNPEEILKRSIFGRE